MLPRDVSKVTMEDLQRLIEARVPEGQTMEYKVSIELNRDSTKEEFLCDISSFANTAGGWIIFGIQEENTCPVDIPGVQVDNLDSLRQTIDNLLRDGFEPRIPGVSIGSVRVSGTEERYAIVLYIPKSYCGPHMVTFKGNRKFYARNNSGKYPMSVDELRLAFVFSEAFAEKARAFRKERIATIFADEAPLPLLDSPPFWFIMHLIPYGAFSPGRNYNAEQLQNLARSCSLEPFYSSGWNESFNADGFLLYSQAQGKVYSYLQLFRNGIIEAVTKAFCHVQKLCIFIDTLEYAVLEKFPKCCSFLQQLGVEPPIAVFLTFFGIRGYRLARLEIPYSTLELLGDNPFPRDVLFVPEIVLEKYENLSPSDLDAFFKPSFDIIWNAFGFPKSRNYDENGKRIRRGK
ncbi:MAG: ATP-binding protein [Candidatus Atribacteria bacterium]|nr:ATP-binding protein [Candidatus Atribacteria bacterium]